MFGLELWLVWLIVGIFFIVTEIFTAGFVMLPIGLAALSSSLIAYLIPSAGLAPQLLAFIFTGIIFVFFGQKIANKIVKDSDVKVGADRLIDQVGIVVDEINDMKNSGKVRIVHEEWRARSEDDSVIPEGKKVKIVAIDGTQVIVNLIK